MPKNTEIETPEIWRDAIVKTGKVNVDEILFNEKNFKIHPRAQKNVVEQSIKTVGFVRPLIINLRTSELWSPNDRNVQTLLDGHLRAILAAEKGVKKLRVDYVDLTPEQEDFLLSMLDPVGNMAVIDKDKWALLAQKNIKQQPDSKQVMGELAKKMRADKQLAKAGNLSELNFDPETPIEKMDGKLPGVNSLKDWVIFNLGNNVFDIPDLKPDMIMDIPEKLQTYVGPNNEYDPNIPFLYMWGSDSVRGLEMKRTIIAFYVDDNRFETFWYLPAEHTGKLLNAGVMGAITPNFSLAVDVPKIVRMWQRYRAMWCSRYFQEAGIKVIPDVPLNWVDGDDILLGMPTGCNFATQLHTKMSEEDWESTLNYFEYIMQKHLPEKVMVYADKPGWAMVERRFEGTPILSKIMWVQDRVGLRRSYMDKENRKNFGEKTQES